MNTPTNYQGPQVCVGKMPLSSRAYARTCGGDGIDNVTQYSNCRGNGMIYTRTREGEILLDEKWW